MDLICPVCGEAWDMESVYGENDRPDLTRDQAARLFRKKGCGAIFDGVSCRPTDSDTTALARATYEALGDDMDGAAAMFDDFAGMID